MLSTLAVLIISSKKPQLVTPSVLIAQTQPNFDTDVLAPLKIIQTKEAAEALAAKQQAEAVLVAQQAQEAYTAPVQATGTLVGSMGYSHPWGNCVLEPGVDNPGWGNPIDWPVLYNQPSIGATVLFTWNHVAVVSGIWSNGDIEVRQQNSGGSSRVPAYEIKGYR